LGHLISEPGIEPVPEKLEDMKNAPAPTDLTLTQKFLGLAGYYRKFVPRFADIARPLTNLTHKDVDFVWDEKCQEAFDFLKDKLMSSPVLVYPDPTRPYVLFTDASKYAWACVLTQPYSHEIEGKTREVLHPITYKSGLFHGSQLNWATLTKEAYAIYMSVKKLSYYLEDADITLRSDHLPLKRFLEKNTLNNKVNNWAVELEQYRIQFEYIKGIKNTLADTMSRLIKIDPDCVNPKEPKGHEYGYALFEELEPIQSVVVRVITRQMAKRQRAAQQKIQQPATSQDDTEPEPDQDKDELLDGQVPFPVLLEEQLKDPFCAVIFKRLKRHPQEASNPYFIQDQMLMRHISMDGIRHNVFVLPQCLIPRVLVLAHDLLGHNGSRRTYDAVRRLYYWQNMKLQIRRHVRGCATCQKHNPNPVSYQKLHFRVPQTPMQFISMDLIGEFHPPSSKGNRFALTVICMLTGFTTVVPIPDKTADTVVQAYLDNVYTKLGGSMRILSDNGTEFKNELFEKVAKMIGVQHKLYSAPYHPQSNGRIECFHAFFKACLRKHIAPRLEWDDLVPMACAAYNFMPNEHSSESPFFLMYGRDPVLPLNTLLKPAIRYMGNDQSLLSLDLLKTLYLGVAQNLELSRKREVTFHPPDRELRIGDMVLIRNHTAKAWDDRYLEGYRILSFPSRTQVEVRNKTDHTRVVHRTDIKLTLPALVIASHVPNAALLGRNVRFQLDHFPDLEWKLSSNATSIQDPA
jgi:transposase InsO family protein